MILSNEQKKGIRRHHKIKKSEEIKDKVNEQIIEKNNNINPQLENDKINKKTKKYNEDNRNFNIKENHKKTDEIIEQKMDNINPKIDENKKNEEINIQKGENIKSKKKVKNKMKKNKTDKKNFQIEENKINGEIKKNNEDNEKSQIEIKNDEIIEQKIDPQTEKKNNNEEIIEQKKDKNLQIENNIKNEDIIEMKMYNTNPKDEKEKKKEEIIEKKGQKKKLKKKSKKNKADYINNQTDENIMNEEKKEQKMINRNSQIEIINSTEKSKDYDEIMDNKKNEKIIEKKGNSLKNKKKIFNKKMKTNNTDYINLSIEKNKINEEIKKHNEDNENPQVELKIKNDEINEKKFDNKSLQKKKNKKAENYKEDNGNPKIEDNKEIINQKEDKKMKKSINLMNPKKVIKKRAPSAQIFKNINNKRKNNLYAKLNICSFFPNKNDHQTSTPGLIGLMNIGATCYMNATLQCFSNIPKLREYLIEKKTYFLLKKYKATHKLSFALAEVIKNLWEILDKRFYPPENFKNVISEMNPLFKGIAANDPKDLILFLLENMHKELNSHKSNKDNKDNNNNFSLFNNNFIEEYNCFRQSYINKNKSIISDEFYGFNNTITSCGNCRFTINNIQVYNILFFPLEEIRKYKNYTDNNVKIIDCFEYHTKIDYNQEFYCNSCGQNCGSISQTKLINVPHTLIINLNRGKGLEYNVNIIFDEYLNLNKYINDENSPYYYELIGVICHFGSNDMGGHFIAFCKNYNNCEWYKYNDQMVTKCLFNEVKQSGLPYVLFYNYVQTYDKIND